ncbi:hypothetical protein [Actinopolymorpha sp. B9G3]|uniref:hypothetical protein n=1 Tax=Actinopolymorpha sp. B9G3 TaxID=3158970 RepID=UPI0032D8EDB0
MLKEQTYQLDHMYLALFNVLGSAVRLMITLALVMSVHPAMVLLLVFALPTVWVSARRSAVSQRVYEEVAPHERRHRHLFMLGTTQASGKEFASPGSARTWCAARARSGSRGTHHSPAHGGTRRGGRQRVGASSRPRSWAPWW